MTETSVRSGLVCGIEIHVELATKSKMFCGCVNDPFGAPEPNIYTCPVCLGMPGALPVANKKAIEWTIKIGLALGCEIALFSKFDRKHYFYPDLPKGYQISQYDQPLCTGGSVKTSFGPVGITRVHLEEDTGKLIHQEVDGKKVSLIDYNRSSVPLVEIVTEPDIHTSAQAKEFTKKIAQIIRMLEVSSADMEKGSMRLEANISVRHPDDGENLPPYKVEVKNLNSFRYIERAIEYEFARQQTIRERGEIPTQETRGWNESKGQTFPQRTKESAEDYRYFPDPDLPPLRLTPSSIALIKKQLPLLPEELVKRWTEQGVKPQEAEILADAPATAWVTEQILQDTTHGSEDQRKLLTQWVNKKISIPGERMTALLTVQGETREEAIKRIAADLWEQSLALASVTTVDHNELSGILQAVIAENPKAVADYKAGKTQVIGFLMGMCSRKLGTKVDPNILREALEHALA